MRCRYNTANCLTNIHKRHPYLARGMRCLFIDPASDWYSDSISAIIYAISYFIRLHYNRTLFSIMPNLLAMEVGGLSHTHSCTHTNTHTYIFKSVGYISLVFFTGNKWIAFQLITKPNSVTLHDTTLIRTTCAIWHIYSHGWVISNLFLHRKQKKLLFSWSSNQVILHDTTLIRTTSTICFNERPY